MLSTSARLDPPEAAISRELRHRMASRGVSGSCPGVTIPSRGSSAAGRRRLRARRWRGPCAPRISRPSSASSRRGARRGGKLPAHGGHSLVRSRRAVTRLPCHGEYFFLTFQRHPSNLLLGFARISKLHCGVEIPLAEFLGSGSRCAVRVTRLRGQSEDRDVHVLSSLAILA